MAAAAAGSSINKTGDIIGNVIGQAQQQAYTRVNMPTYQQYALEQQNNIAKNNMNNFMTSSKFNADQFTSQGLPGFLQQMGGGGSSSSGLFSLYQQMPHVDQQLAGMNSTHAMIPGAQNTAYVGSTAQIQSGMGRVPDQSSTPGLGSAGYTRPPGTSQQAASQSYNAVPFNYGGTTGGTYGPTNHGFSSDELSGFNMGGSMNSQNPFPETMDTPL